MDGADDTVGNHCVTGAREDGHWISSESADEAGISCYSNNSIGNQMESKVASLGIEEGADDAGVDDAEDGHESENHDQIFVPTGKLTALLEVGGDGRWGEEGPHSVEVLHSSLERCKHTIGWYK